MISSPTRTSRLDVSSCLSASSNTKKSLEQRCDSNSKQSKMLSYLSSWEPTTAASFAEQINATIFSMGVLLRDDLHTVVKTSPHAIVTVYGAEVAPSLLHCHGT